MSKKNKKMPIIVHIESMSVHLGDSHSTTYYNSMIEETGELELEEEVSEDDDDDSGTGANVKQGDEEYRREVNRVGKEADTELRRISELPRAERDFFKAVLGSVLQELK